MIHKLLNSESKTITGAALVVGAASLVSRFLGFIRDRVLAGQFGAGDTLDIYYAAFRIPDLIFNLLILGALSAGFIPLFMQTRMQTKTDDQRSEGWRLANNLINIMGVVLILTCGLFIIFSSKIVPLITPGFNGEKLSLTIKLTQIMMLSPILLGFSNILGSILQSFKRFFIYSLAPIVYNLGIIIGALIFVKWWDVYGLAFGVVLGAFFHLLVQLPTTCHLGWRYKWVFDVTHEGVKKISKLMIPRTLALAVSQINLVVITIIATTLASGSLAVFNLANNLQYFPIGIIGISYAVAAFPLFSEFASQGKREEMVKSFSHTVRQILFFIIPVTVLFLVLRAQIVRVVLGSGKFDWEDTILTSDALAFFALSLFAQALIPLLARFFYALQDTKTPFIIGLVSAAVNVIAALFLARTVGAAGLALAFSIANLVNFCLLWICLRMRFGSLDEGNILDSTLKISVASLLMALTCQAMKFIIEPFVNMQTFLGIFEQGVGAGLAGLGVFVMVGVILKSKELIALYRTIRHRLFKIKLPFNDETNF